MQKLKPGDRVPILIFSEFISENGTKTNTTFGFEINIKASNIVFVTNSTHGKDL